MATIPPTITAAPTPPDRSDRATFSTRATASFEHLKDHAIPEIAAVATNVYNNALAAAEQVTLAAGHASNAQTYRDAAAASAASALNAPGTSAISTATMTLSTGAKAFSVQSGKAFVVGQFVVIAKTSSPSNYMVAQITAHNSGTGAMVVNSVAYSGSGTHSDWTVALTADRSPGPAPAYGYVNASGDVSSAESIVDTRSASVTLALPASPNMGDAYAFTDAFLSFGVHPMTLGRSGHDFHTGARTISEDLICDVAGVAFKVVFDGTYWRLF